MTMTGYEPTRRIASRLALAGRVQGIGLRPAVVRFARELSLTGYVANTRFGVEIHVEGPSSDVARFEQQLRGRLPRAARTTHVRVRRVEPTGYEEFVVRGPSDPTRDRDGGDSPRSPLPSSAVVPPDVVVCDECLADTEDVSDRRHDYPFTSCADCGPRYSIIDTMPYDRERTSMQRFPLCERCRREHASPGDRRFHAQTIACPECGPRVWLRDADERIVARGIEAIRAAGSALRGGHIVALRGLGGYQLLVDATSRDAVQRLRERKRRRGKPLAVMVATLAHAERIARLDDFERRLLTGPEGPIVVVALRGADSPVDAVVTAGLDTIGLMLPTTPMHRLLLEDGRRPVVCTSGNVEGEPLVHGADAAREELRSVADVWLEHDRPIRRPIDDSVVRSIAGRAVTIRSARGYAPLPLDLPSHRPLVALGGHQKAAIALSNGAQAVLGPHVGDLHSVAARERFVQQLTDLAELYGIDVQRVVVDRHPEYFTTQWAESNAADIDSVQHHHAHVVAGMLEHGWLDRRVLGVSFDGTGYGTDRTIWGGEFLRATAKGFRRVGHLRPFALPGGERAVRQPWRVATALVREAAGEHQAARLSFRAGEAAALLPLLRNTRWSPTTTSAGRLFDGTAAIVLGVECCEYEGQAAALLESACDLAESGRYDMPLVNTKPAQVDWRTMVRQILLDRRAGVAPGTMAMRFHRGLARAIWKLCRRFSELPVVLGGGVFQNRVLVELLAERFGGCDQPLGTPGRIPPNDGGLAAGQLAVAVARRTITEERIKSCA